MVAFFNHFFSHFSFLFSEKIRSKMRAKMAFLRKTAIMLVFRDNPFFSSFLIFIFLVHLNSDCVNMSVRWLRQCHMSLPLSPHNLHETQWAPTMTINDCPWGPTTKINGWQWVPTNVHRACQQDWQWPWTLITTIYKGLQLGSTNGYNWPQPSSTNGHRPSPQLMNGHRCHHNKWSWAPTIDEWPISSLTIPQPVLHPCSYPISVDVAGIPSNIKFL